MSKKTRKAPKGARAAVSQGKRARRVAVLDFAHSRALAAPGERPG